jgi:anti-sigma factor RsiW
MLASYLDGQLDSVRHHAVERHVDQCGNCAADARLVRRLYGLLDATAVPRIPPHLEARLMERIRAREVETGARRPWRWIVPATVAAGIAGIAAGALLDHWLTWPRPAARPAPAQVSMTPTSVVAAVPVPDPSGGAETPVSMPVAAAARANGPPSSPESAARSDGSLATGASVLPAHLRDALDLFVDYPIIRDLDKFEHYETIEAGRSVTGGETRGG